MRREIPVEQAVGMPLAHDLTRIVPGQFKGRQFAKGHIIRPEDVPMLLDMGKRYVWVLELEPGELHENDAAERMAAALAGPGLTKSDVHEGKVVLRAAHDGMLWVDADRVHEMNRIDDISIATRTPFQHVTAGTSVASVRPIPLVIAEEKVRRVEEIAKEAGERAVIDVLSYREHRAALVTTGSEVQTGRIEDKAGPVLREKMAKYGVPIVSQVFPGDDVDAICAAIEDAIASGATLVLVTGGMSVDPDDRSPAAIRRAASEVVTYGTPMLPGSMLMLAYRGDVAIFGLPGSVLHDPVTSFDILLPRVLAGIRLTKADIARHGVGGWLGS
jgi:molybdenum cofactor synthesis domain-containing protein